MASVQAHCLNLIMRWTVKRKMRGVTDVKHVRAALENVSSRLPAGIRATSAVLGGVRGEWVSCDAAVPRGTLLYLHGGGYIACSPLTHRPITMAYARRGLRVFVPDYRLAPEHPFPAAIEDAVAAWRALRETTQGRLVTAGDSAGGGLALAMMLTLRAAGEPMPDRAALFSPWTDLAVTGASVDANSALDAMFSADMIRRAPAAYLGETDARDPLASPLYADLHGLSPLLIHVGARETLLDDSRRLAARAQAAGVDVTLTVWPVVPHVWQLAQGLVPEAGRSVSQAAAFLLEGAAPIAVDAVDAAVDAPVHAAAARAA